VDYRRRRIPHRQKIRSLEPEEAKRDKYERPRDEQCKGGRPRDVRDATVDVPIGSTDGESSPDEQVEGLTRCRETDEESPAGYVVRDRHVEPMEDQQHRGM
jgi:hypothetical protein